MKMNSTPIRAEKMVFTKNRELDGQRVLLLARCDAPFDGKELGGQAVPMGLVLISDGPLPARGSAGAGSP